MKIRNILFLTAFLLHAIYGNSQSFSCINDSLLKQRSESKPSLEKLDNQLIKEFKKYYPNITNYNKPQPPPECDMCLLSPECVQTKYMLPVLVHVVAQPGHTTIGSGSNISNSQIQNAILTLNKQFSAFGISHPSSVNTGIQFYLAPVGPQSSGVFTLLSLASCE
jgi:hypothetical protein